MKFMIQIENNNSNCYNNFICTSIHNLHYVRIMSREKSTRLLAASNSKDHKNLAINIIIVLAASNSKDHKNLAINIIIILAASNSKDHKNLATNIIIILAASNSKDHKNLATNIIIIR